MYSVILIVLEWQYLHFVAGTKSATAFFFTLEKIVQGGKALCCFFHLGMNLISPGARFTEPTRENKDALIRNIRGKKVIAVVNELYRWLWVLYMSLLSHSFQTNNLFRTHQTRLRSHSG